MRAYVKLKQTVTQHETKPMTANTYIASTGTFIFSLLPIPPAAVERWFSHGVFLKFSTLSGFIGDATPIAWLDILLVLSILYISVCIRRRRWMAIAYAVALAYLVFFWSWGLN